MRIEKIETRAVNNMRTVKRWGYIVAIGTAVCGTLLAVALYLKPPERKEEHASDHLLSAQVASSAPNRPESGPVIVYHGDTIGIPSARPFDAFEKVLNAQRSGDPIEVFAALEIAGSCQGVVNTQNDFLLFESGAPSLVIGELSDSRRSGIQRLFDYCKGFIKAGKVRTIELFRTTSGRAGAIARDLVVSSEVREQEITRGLRLISSGNPQAVDAGVATLLKSVEVGGVPSASKDSDIASLAMLGVACDLNADCTAEGLKMSTMCALSNICNVNWLEFLKQDLTSTEKERFEAIRVQYLAWLKKATSSGTAALTFTPTLGPP